MTFIPAWQICYQTHYQVGLGKIRQFCYMIDVQKKLAKKLVRKYIRQ